MRDDAGTAERLRGLGPVGILAGLVVLAGNFLVPPLSALLVLAWAGWSRTPWSALGLARSRNWIASVAVGAAFGVAFKLAMKAIVMPLLGAPALNPAYHFLVGNTAALPGMLLMVVLVAGVGEEILFRGYLFERLGRLLGTGGGATALTVALTAALFGAGHLAQQGLPGAEQAAIVGLVYGTIYSRTRSLWMLMAAHAAFDVTAVLIIYGDLETAVARSSFHG